VLHADKRALDKVLTQRQGELDELHSRLKASMVRGRRHRTCMYLSLILGKASMGCDRRRRSTGDAAPDLQMFATDTWHKAQSKH
jgi:hypothetical protein